MKRYITAILMLFFISGTDFFLQQHVLLGAQNPLARFYDKGPVSVRLPEKSDIDRIRRNKDFQYAAETVQGRTIIDIISDWLVKHIFSALVSKESKMAMRLIPYIIIAAAIVIAVIVLRRGDFFGLFTGKGARRGAVSYNTEEDIHAIDYDSVISKYYSENDFRLALRYRFLKTLSRLAEYGIIDWKIEKTNRDYIKEVRSKIAESAFPELVSYFEFVWYGNFSLEKEYLDRIFGEFNSFDSSAGLAR